MANFITLFRILVVFVSAWLLFKDSTRAYVLAYCLTAFAFALDGLDGYVARKFNETSKLGAMLDIMSDRIAENTYWVIFAALGWLPPVFAVIALTRSFIVDGIRSVAMEQGFTAFGETSMQKDKVGAFICGSKFMRITYAVAKVLAFIGIILAMTPGMDRYLSVFIYTCSYLFAVLAIMLCVLRGLPVVFESKKLFVKNEEV